MAPGGRACIEHDNGIGDATLALPLKRIFQSRRQKRVVWTFKPMLRVPFSGTDDYEIYDNEMGQRFSAWGTNTRPLNLRARHW